ncbi:glutamate/tyrosine decarboxylase-like PLP-dependent enzyme [Bacilli bacterium PM5-3]|nr:glutamate/tyrosine decarboxylase-like PLP-dependent enzyme [Bacilli bacterium PM5-3]MDH6603450.1 glutamate/tyrosine decarboxylase-like PLP-dependent enzyme [Bacilli bacterium PM5-9]
MEKFTSEIIEQMRNEECDERWDYTFNKIKDYLNIDNREIFPNESDLSLLDNLDKELNDQPDEASDIIEQLAFLGEKTTTLSSSARYFGFVVGSSFPIALQARLLADTWDQNSALYLMSPLASKIEEICEKWMIDLLQFPSTCAMGIVSGSASATILALNAACYKINREERSKIKVVIGEQAHATVFKSLKILGITSKQMVLVPCDEKGKIKVDELPILDDNTIVILQAGNVNGGAYDDFETICKLANEKGAWIHVDGAFGLYAHCCDNLNHLTKGVDLASSWSVDAHKTLNTPYDNGIVLCKDKDIYLESLKAEGSYLVGSNHRDGMSYTNEMSRRARSIELWATLKALGKQGVSDLVYELACKAKYFALELEKIGFDVLNEVVFNQVVVYFKDDETTKKILELINNSGVCFMSSATWQNKFVIRISVSSYKTTYTDIDECLEVIKKICGDIKN